MVVIFYTQCRHQPIHPHLFRLLPWIRCQPWPPTWAPAMASWLLPLLFPLPPAHPVLIVKCMTTTGSHLTFASKLSTEESPSSWACHSQSGPGSISYIIFSTLYTLKNLGSSRWGSSPFLSHCLIQALSFAFSALVFHIPLPNKTQLPFKLNSNDTKPQNLPWSHS